MSLLPFIVYVAVILALLWLLKIYFNGGVNTYHPDLSGKIVVITGANGGIGFQTATELTKLNP